MYYFYMGSELLPIPPEKLSLKIKNTNKTLTLINEGEINFLREAGLTELEFKVIIPAVQHPFAKYEDNFKSPAYFLNYFEELKTKKEPFQFIVSRKMPNGNLLFDTDITVSLEEYTIEESAKEVFDLVVSIKLKQYRPFGTKIVKVINAVASDKSNSPALVAKVESVREQTNSPAPKQQTTYTIQKGDTLWSIAKAIYGSGTYWEIIYEANKDSVSAINYRSPKFDQLKDETTLIIPDKPTAKSTFDIMNEQRKGQNGVDTSTLKGKGDLTFTKSEIF